MSIQKRMLARFGLDNNSKSIINVADPVNAQDAATKNFASNASNLLAGTIPAARFPYVPVNQAGDYVTGLFGMSRVSAIGPTSVTNASNGLWHPLAIPMSDGKCLYTDEEFLLGMNGVGLYNNSGGTAVQLSLVSDPLAPNASKQVIKIAYDGSGNVSPNLGGFIQQMNAAANKMFVQRFRAKIPTGYFVNNNENSMGTNYITYWLTPLAGTGKYEDYIRVTLCGDSGPFSTGGHVSLQGPAGAVTWYLASCTTFDLTSKVINNGDETQTSILNKLGITSISGVNTGDETTASIKSKLGITTLSGSNTGDETNATILSKLGASQVTGSNTGDETQTSILNKLGYTGGYSQLIAGADLNNLRLNGQYRGANLVNAPGSNAGWWYVTVEGHDTSWTKQTATAFGSGNVASITYVRTCYSGTWGGWICIIDGGYDTNYQLKKRRTRFNSADGTSINSVNQLETGFDYDTGGAGITGPFLHFGGLGGYGDYGCQIVAAYGNGNTIKFRTRNDDTQVWNPWRELWHSGNYPVGTYSAPDKVQTLTATTATTTLDLSVAAVFEVTLSANTTFAFDFSKVPALSNGLFAFVLTILNDATAGRGVSFPSGTKWAGGQIPARTTAANAKDDWYFYSRDGVNWVGSLSNQDVR